MIMEQEFHRIRRLPPYVFAEVNAMKARARTAGDDIIDFGMGNPDQPTPPHIVRKLTETVQDPRTHRYSSSRGIAGLRKAISAYYGRRFGLDVDPETETIVTLGSKEGLANLAAAVTSPGDVILVPNPSYPIHQFGFIIAGASVCNVPVKPDGDFLKAMDRAVHHSVPKPAALVLNYPNNPTAEVADLDFYTQVVDYCRREGIYIFSDLAYSELYFDGPPPPSLLQVPGRPGHRRGIHLHEQDLFHARLADRFRHRQQAAYRGLAPHQVLPGLRRLSRPSRWRPPWR